MTRDFSIDGVGYDAATLSPEGKALLDLMSFAQTRVRELMNQQALLTKAKNAYIADLKSEIIHGRTGVELGALFSDD